MQRAAPLRCLLPARRSPLAPLPPPPTVLEWILLRWYRCHVGPLTCRKDPRPTSSIPLGPSARTAAVPPKCPPVPASAPCGTA
jgi:hypothetical protein